MSESWDPLAACGLDCGACPIRKAANDRGSAEELAEDWRKTGHPEAEADWFKCQGCHGPEGLVWGKDCKIRECCAKDRRLKNCGQCVDFPCELIIEYENDGHAHHRAAIKRLREMKERRS